MLTARLGRLSCGKAWRGVNPTFVIGDPHGQFEKVVGLLRDAGLIDAAESWSGADSTLWLMGDLVDRGPGGLETVALAMRLQREAARVGGMAETLLGNHDALLLSAYRFGDRPCSGPDGTFRSAWESNGGETRDLEGLKPDQARWLASLPAMARAGPHLLMHADAMLYEGYGQSIDEVNRAISSVLASDDAERWDRLLDAFSEHRAFVGGAPGTARAEAILARYGGSRIVHGHSPIQSMPGDAPTNTREALVYAAGLCINVDGGMYKGGPGFVYRLPETA